MLLDWNESQNSAQACMSELSTSILIALAFFMAKRNILAERWPKHVLVGSYDLFEIHFKS